MKSWLTSALPYSISNFTEREFEGKRDFVLYNHMQKIKMQCGIEMDTFINNRIERTLSIYSDLPYLDHKKKEEINDFQEELSRRHMDEFFDAKALKFIEN